MRFVNHLGFGICLLWLSMASAGYAQTVQKDAPRRNAPGPTVVVQQARAQTYEESVARGQGAFLRGAGWYNLRTAQARAINIEANKSWIEHLRKAQSDRRAWDDQKAYQNKRDREELHREMAKRDHELRTNPTSKDVLSGAALNILIYDLTDPDFFGRWQSVSPVPLPAGASVKKLVFTFTPPSASTQASAALSRGVIALSRLEIKDNWPSMMTKDELAKERKAYEDAYTRAKDKVVSGEYAVDEILALDAALKNLKSKVMTEIPSEFGYRTATLKFVENLSVATRMFDANTVDYAREILIDTKDHDATTVEELVEFMTKYRLQFANSQSSSTAPEVYQQIYERLRQQYVALVGKPGTSPPPIPDPSSGGTFTPLFNGRDLTGWFVESGPPDRFKVQNGILMVRGELPRSFLLTDREFSDFVLRLEFSLDSPAVSGIALRAIRGEKITGPKGKGDVVFQHPFFALANGSDRVTTGTLRYLMESGFEDKAKAAVLKPKGEWNRLQIEVRGPSLRAAINDDEVRNVSLVKGSKYPDGTIAGLARTKGRIGLQSINGNLRFRNIEILELSPSK
jgi:hypothetical protein